MDAVTRYAQHLIDTNAHLATGVSPGRAALYNEAFAERDPQEPLWREAFDQAQQREDFVYWLNMRGEIANDPLDELSEREAAFADLVAHEALALLGQQAAEHLVSDALDASSVEADPMQAQRRGA
jgi:hypothetical protein